MRRGSLERDKLKMRKVKVGTLGTTVQSPWLQGLRWNITWNKARTIECLTSIVYFVMLETSISPKSKGYGVATMTVLSRAKEFGFEFWFLKDEKKAPPISRQG